MKCPKCNASLICVLESRHTDARAISRRRQCKSCEHVWFTAEVEVPTEGVPKNYKWGKFKVNDEVVEELCVTSGWFKHRVQA